MQTTTTMPAPSGATTVGSPTPAERLARYTTVKLVADESKLSVKERQMLPLLIDAARAVNGAFWAEAYGNRDDLMRTISDPVVRRPGGRELRDAHGRANVVAFNFLQNRGAFAREANGKYRVNMAKMREGTDLLSGRILTIQGNGDYDGAGAFYSELGSIGTVLAADLARLGARAIPVDIVYDQGK